MGAMSLRAQQHDRCDGDHRQVVALALLVPGGDPAELLELVDRALHSVALAVSGLVEAALTGLVGLGRDHRPDPTPAQVAPQARVAVALVNGHRVRPDPRPTPTRPLDRAGLHQPTHPRALLALAPRV